VEPSSILKVSRMAMRQVALPKATADEARQFATSPQMADYSPREAFAGRTVLEATEPAIAFCRILLDMRDTDSYLKARLETNGTSAV
jgi:hypothetical protein